MDRSLTWFILIVWYELLSDFFSCLCFSLFFFFFLVSFLAFLLFDTFVGSWKLIFSFFFIFFIFRPKIFFFFFFSSFLFLQDGTHVFTLNVPTDDRSEDTTATYILEANFLGSFGGVGGPLPGSPFRIQTCPATDYDNDEKKAIVCFTYLRCCFFFFFFASHFLSFSLSLFLSFSLSLFLSFFLSLFLSLCSLCSLCSLSLSARLSVFRSFVILLLGKDLFNLIH